ncbi:MAG: PKD domain-containing protein [Cyanobacteriota bacterium]
MQDFRDPQIKTFCYFKIKLVDKPSGKIIQEFSQNFVLEPSENNIEITYKQTENVFDFLVKTDQYESDIKYIWSIEEPSLKFNTKKEFINNNKFHYRFTRGGKYKVKLEVYKTKASTKPKDQFLGKKELELIVAEYLKITAQDSGMDYKFKALDTFFTPPSKPQYKWDISNNSTVLENKTIDGSNDYQYKFNDEGNYLVSVVLLDSSTSEIYAVAETTAKPQKQKDDTSQNTDDAKLLIPNNLKGTDIIDVKLELSKELEAKTKQIYWALPGYLYLNNKDIDNKNDKKELQLQVINRSYQTQGEAFVRLYDDKGDEIHVSDQIKVTITPVGIGISASDIWEAGTDGKNAGGKRKPAILKRMKDGAQTDSATIGGNVGIKWVDMLNNYDDAKLKAEYDKLIQSGQYKQMRPLDIQGFKGYLLVNPVKTKYSGNQHGYVDLAHPEAEASVRGYIFKGKEGIKIEGSVYGGGTRLGVSPKFAYDDMPFVEAQTNTAFNELLAIIDSIKIVPDPKRDTFPYKGPALDGSDVAIIKLEANKTTLNTGDIIEVKTIVENYKKDLNNLKYNWSGDHEGTGKSVNFIAGQPGKYSLSVNVEDVDGSIGTASVEFNVENFEVKISKIAPSQDTATFGSEASFSAEIVSGNTGGQSNIYVYHWEASENVPFEPQDATTSTTKTFLNYPEKIKFWVTLQKKDGEGVTTIGTSNQIEITITQPELSIVVDKATPGIGEEIKATVNTSTNADNISFDWEELPENAKLLNESQDSKEITFILKDTKAAKIKVTAKTITGNNDLGQAEITVAAKGYEVSIVDDGPKYSTNLPVIWKQGTGLIEVSSEYAVNQDVNFSASIKDSKETDISFQWKAGDGCNIVGANNGTSVTLNRSEAGSCQVDVVASDAKGIKLGEGSAEFKVTISQDDLKTAENIRTKVNDLIKQSNSKAQNGDLSGAINDAKTAADLDPNNPVIPGLINQLNNQNQQVNNLITQANNQVNKVDLEGTQKTLDDITKIDSNNPAVKEITANINKKINDNYKYLESKILEIDNVIKVDKEFDQALTMASQLRTSHKLNQHFSDWLAKEETWAKQQIQNKLKSKDLLRAGESKFNNKDFVGADVDFSNGLDTYDIWSKRDPEPLYYGKLRDQARENIKILGSISSKVFQAISYQGLDPAFIENTINDGKYAINLSPVYEPRMPEWLKALEEKRQAILKLLADRQNANSNNTTSTKINPGNNISSSQPVQTPIKYIDNFNGGGCSFTDNAKIKLEIPFDVSNLQIWYLWDSNEQTVPYKIIKDGQIVNTGHFIKGACDPYQAQWCGGDTNTKLLLNPGIYDIKLDKAKLCQNSASSNNGFIRVFGSKSQTTRQPDTSAQNNTTYKPAYTAPQNVSSNVLTNKMLNISFVNQSGENVHFYGMGGKCSPDNMIMPGGSTNHGVTTQYKIIEYYVGRNGQTIGTVKIPVESLKNGQTVKLIYSNGLLRVVEPIIQSGNTTSNNYQASYNTSIAGTWNVKACGYTAILELNGSSGNITGRIKYNVLNTWEPVVNIQYNNSTGQISFKRTQYPQVHTGIVTGNKMTGKLVRYEVPGNLTCQWEASR